MDRNTAERQRRSTMRNLFSRLYSLLPPQPTRISMPDMLELARLYINQFQRHVEELRTRRVQLQDQQIQEPTNESTSQTVITPILNITELNSTMEVNLITGLNVTFTLSEIIRVIEEEGAQVLSVAYNTAENRMILSIHCQAAYPRIGIESSRLRQRLSTMIEE